MIHDAHPVSQAGPGGSNSWAVCSCGWEGRTRLTRAEASTDAAAHLKGCLLHAFETEAK